MIRRILAALDESVRAPLVFERACEIAAAVRAELILFRTIAVPQEYPAAGAGQGPDELAPHLAERARQDLTFYAERHPELQIRVVVRVSMSPDQAIVDASEQLDVDLIIVGSHGYSGWDRLLGTTTTGVVNRSRRDVLVVHDRAPSKGPAHSR